MKLWKAGLTFSSAEIINKIIIVSVPWWNCFISISWFYYPGYQRFFSRAAGIFGVGRRPKLRAAKKPETALEKSLAPMVWLYRSIMCMGKGSKKCQNWPETVFLHFRNERQTFWDCYKGRGKTVGQWRSPAPPVTIPETIAGIISAPVPGSFQKWRVTS